MPYIFTTISPMSLRLFSEHTLRRIHSLERTWTFLFPQNGTEIASDTDPCDARGQMMTVPSVWQSIPEYVNYRGQALALCTVEQPTRGPLRLVFEGVSHTCRVFFDGEEVGRHHNAYTRFAVNLPEVAAGTHELRLWISNEHGELSALHVPNDYYNYGGISRPAEIQHPARAVIIERIHITPFHDGQRWKASVRCTLNHFGSEALSNLELQLTVAGQRKTVPVGLLEPGTKEVECEFEFDEVSCWNPDQPALYEAVAELAETGSAPFDDLRDRFGFRTVAVEGQDILLNGQPLYLAGVNRHEDHPDFGCALPVEMMQRDLAIIQELGCNLVRTSHYSNDPRFLDLCDERGILVWEESHARGLFDENSQHPRYVEQTRENTEEMVLAHYNHAAIIIWGYLNECDSWTENGREAYRVAEAAIKAIDVSRPTTYAACHHDKDQCQQIPDVISWNRYPLWYGDESPADSIEQTIRILEAQGAGHKPLILSEFGGGAFYGYRDHFRRGKWSEDRQTEILDGILTPLLAHERVMGAIIWQYCDVRVDDEWAFGRPRTMNNKGIVDEYRRPKTTFSVVQKHFRERLAKVSYGTL